MEKIKTASHLNDEITPYELYLKLLGEYFGSSIDYDPNSLGDLPPNFIKLRYQIDAVNEAFGMLEKHNGCVLADVVGLGKTVIAALLAKKFLLNNGKDYTKILVVYPPALEINWKNTFRDFGLDSYTKFITNGSLHKIVKGDLDYWELQDYDLVIVDEAHKFRNHETEGFKNLQRICKAPKNIDDVKDKRKKVVLVTATPLNNKPEDILHQISLFQDTKMSTLPITNLTRFFSQLKEQYQELKRSDELNIEKLREIYEKIRKYVVEPITIRRTRKDILNIPEYRDDMKKQGISFPEVEVPHRLEYFLGTELTEIFYNTIFYLTDEDKIQYFRYQAIWGLKPEVQVKYYENAERVAKSLTFIMKTLLVKRLESSFYAFKKSLNSLKISTDNMIQMFEQDKIIIAPDLDINKLLDKGLSFEDIEEEIKLLSDTNSQNNVFKKDDFKSEFLNGLKKDSKLLTELLNNWENIARDPKLEKFISCLNEELLNPKTNPGGKLVIFSESKDTVHFLQNELEKEARNDIISITSGNRKNKYNEIVNNFDANIPKEKQRDDYNILISTEVLSEGVNLHRSNVIVHYDTPWNSTRMMQRIGRVNRIGTVAPKILNYVFYPSAEGDAQIKLRKTALMKLQAFHTAFGEDNQIYSEEEILDEVKLFKGEIKEEDDERLKYLFILRNLKKENPELIEKIRKLPLKIRCGRSNKPDYRNMSVAFIKTKIKNEFYLIKDETGASEITPIEAIKIFEALSDEKPQTLIENHHTHIQSALYAFQISEENNNKLSDPTAKGGEANRAKSFFGELNKHEFVKTEFHNQLKLVVKLIDKGTYTNLSTDIVRLQKKTKKDKLQITEVITELKKIFKNYDIDFHKSEEIRERQKLEPQLILSESFT
ncbi:MAG: hypothetical protein LC102_03620 [Ignavibacteriales bacterium]|nr:hypothetical protein [Ignavibacteriales bacterium]